MNNPHYMGFSDTMTEKELHKRLEEIELKLGKLEHEKQKLLNEAFTLEFRLSLKIGEEKLRRELTVADIQSCK